MYSSQCDANVTIILFWKSEICPFQSAASNSYEPLANNRIFYAYFHVNISVPQCLEIYLKNNRLYIFHLSEQQSHDIAEEEIDPLKLFVRRHVIFYFH